MKGTIKMRNLSVTTRLHIMSALFVMSGILGVIGAMQITKGADMHKLNFLHTKYNRLFHREVYEFANTDMTIEVELFASAAPIAESAISCVV